MLSSKVLSLTYNIETLRSVKKNPLYQIYYVPRVEFNSYEEFFSDYFIKNKPCVLSASNTESWKSVREWVASDGKPNFELLEKLFGAAVVPVADCNVKEYNSQQKQDMLFKDYLDYWQNLKYECDQNPHCLYLKDWHFVRDFPDYEAYKTPEYFTSDWLNEFCEHENDDYRFVYMGPRGTWTPLHVDVFGSYSWSANICGKKKWILFPPGNEKHLHDSSEKMAYSVDVVANKGELLTSDIGIEVVQEPGEIIFVPSGWYHQVWNIEDTISINHNWFNGCNIKYVWECLDRAAQEVEDEIVDCKEMEGWDKQCQVILKSHHGIDYAEFLKLLEFICTSRITNLQQQIPDNKFWHSIFDIIQIKFVISAMIQSSKVPADIASEAKNFIMRIITFLQTVKELTGAVRYVYATIKNEMLFCILYATCDLCLKCRTALVNEMQSLSNVSWIPKKAWHLRSCVSF